MIDATDYPAELARLRQRIAELEGFVCRNCDASGMSPQDAEFVLEARRAVLRRMGVG